MRERTPKYHLIYSKIRLDIINNIYEKNTFLPSETKLMEKYSASKDTIRKSLKLLEKEKLIKGVERKGYIILNDNAFKAHVEKLGYQRENVAHKIVQYKEITIDENLASTTGLNYGSDALYIQRITSLGEIPIFIDYIYIDLYIGANITEEICNDSIYDFFKRENISTQCKHRIFNTRVATSEESSTIGILENSHIVDVKRFTYDDLGYVFEYSNTIFNPEYFEYFE